MRKNILVGVATGFFMALSVMIIIAFIAAKIKYPYILESFKGEKQIYIALLGYGFFGNIALYAIFWYLQKEYIQRGILILTVLLSFIFIVNRFL